MLRLITTSLIIAIILGAAPAFSSEADSLFSAANGLYQNQNYAHALDIYLILEKENYESAPLYFNIGNCYFKQGKLGYAILYYLRAQKLSPRDSDISTNLEFARQFMPTRMEGIKINPVTSFLSSIVGVFTLSFMAWMASILFIILFLYLSAVIFLQWKGLVIKIVIYSLIFLVIVTSGLTSYKYRTEYMTEQGVIIADETRILSGPGEDNDVEFVGVFGLTFEIEKEADNYYLVLFENKRKGWVSKGDVEKI